MKANYEPEIEFYSKPYSVDQLISKFDFQTLIAYYLYGMNTLRAIQEVIDNDLYNELGKTFKDIQEDKYFFTMKTNIVKFAISKMDTCEIRQIKNNLFIYHLN